LGDRQGEADSLLNLGSVEFSQNNYSAARELYGEALATRRSLSDRQGEAISLHGLANVEYSQGNYNGARELYEEALVIRCSLGEKTGVAISCACAGAALAAFRHFRTAALALHGALACAALLGYV